MGTLATICPQSDSGRYLPVCLLRGNLSLMRDSPRPIALFAGWIVTGIVTGVVTSLLIFTFYIGTLHTSPAPGDGILIFILWLLLIPLGTILGLIRAIVVWEKRKGWTKRQETL
jgi:hypothetical protein